MDNKVLLELKAISKSFDIIKRRPGLGGIIKDIFSPGRINLNVIKNVDLQITENERTGLVGKNGSGKSTLIKILCGILKPTTGEVFFHGKNIRKELKSFKQNLGVFWGQRYQLSGEIAFRESLELLKYIYGLENNVYRKRLEYLTEIFRLKEFLSRPLRELSLGQRVLCEASAVFIHSPKIVFLDEPTIGLDLEIKHSFFEALNTIYQNENITLFVTSHSVKDIQLLTERLIVLEDGRIRVDCPTEEFTAKYVKFRKAVIIFSDDKFVGIKKEFRRLLKEREQDRIILEIPSDFSISDIINIVSDPQSIIDIKIEDEDFEDVLLKLYKSKSEPK